MEDGQKTTAYNVDHVEEARDTTSNEKTTSPDEEEGVDLDVLFDHLGNRPYRIIQLILPLAASFLTAIPIMSIVFIGYQPAYQCNNIENVTQLEAYLPDDVTSFTLHDVKYSKCNIDVTVNTSGTSSTHSLSCVAGVNFSMPSHTSFLTEWSLVCDKTGLTELTQTGVFAGQALGSLLFSNLADRYGRKKVYVWSLLSIMVILVGMPFAPNYTVLLAIRILAGFFQSGVNNPAYTMFMELLPQKWRCIASVLDAIMWSSSCVFLAVVAYCMQGVSWRYLSLAYSTVFVFSFFLPWFLDESLRWLIATGQLVEAEKILKKACRMNGKDYLKIKRVFYEEVLASHAGQSAIRMEPIDKKEEELAHDQGIRDDGHTSEGKPHGRAADEEMIAGEVPHEENAGGVPHGDLSADESPGSDGGEHGSDGGEHGSDEAEKSEKAPFSAKYTMLDLFRYPVVLVPLLVCILVRMSNSWFYYAVMLGSAKLSGNRFLNFGILAVLEIPSNLVALFLMPRFNRRPLAFMYGMVAGCSLIASVSFVALGGGEPVTMTLGTVAQYVGMFALIGSFCLLFVYDMEVFPTAMRAIGVGTLTAVIRMTDMAAPFLLVWAEETPWAPGVMVGCMCCLASFFIWFLPETRHRKLPDTIEEIKAWKTKKVDVQLTSAKRRSVD